MKIGILIRQPEELDDWEISLIKEIRKIDGFEIKVLVCDGRTMPHQNKKKTGLKALWPGNFIFKYQIKFENKIFKRSKISEREEVISYLKSIPQIKLYPERKNFVDFFNQQESDKIKPYELDVLLRHGFNIIKGNILTIPKHGIWSLHHADNSVNRGGPAGFWEIVNKEDYVGVTLQELTPELDGGIILDKAYFNINWSFVKNRRKILAQSIILIIKNLKLAQKGRLKKSHSITYYKPLYRNPGLGPTLNYLWIFYPSLIKLIIQRVISKFNLRRTNCWVLYQGVGNILHSPLFRLKPIPLPKGVFWADPFLVEENGEEFVFFENFSYASGKGKISYGILSGNKLEGVKDALVKPYHLSYPNVFKENGDIYMIPETGQNKRLEIYKAIKFPDQWELYSTAFEGEIIADANYFIDNEGEKWMFLNKGTNEDVNTELYVYKIDSLKLNSIIPHEQNPVKIDCRYSRNAGAIFEYEGKRYRPSQLNIKGKYGFGLNINLIKKLTVEEYEEDQMVSILPDFFDNLSGIHHVSQGRNKFLVDVAFRSLK
jgi:hypothetical protein